MTHLIASPRVELSIVFRPGWWIVPSLAAGVCAWACINWWAEGWRPSKPQTGKRILNPGEARTLIEMAHDPHIRLALILLLGTAARVGAVLDLTWGLILIAA